MASILVPVWGVSSDPAAVMRQYTPAGMDAQMGKNSQPIPGNLLWPRPSGFTHGRHTIAVHPDITYSVSILSPRLEPAFERYKHLTFSAYCKIPGSATHPDMMYLQYVHVHLVHGDEAQCAQLVKPYGAPMPSSAAAGYHRTRFHAAVHHAHPRRDVLCQIERAALNEVYTHHDVARVVAHAMDRGIPHFDMPGHTYAWDRGIPGLKVCDNVQPNWHEYCAAPQCGQLELSRTF
ncbi:beta-N-acetylhexosaminidase [Synchytrium endobioticum]|uniref:beta-N-acetylhexosaminidase n=1 Tax=Synchytrium endobioticum TaxID=286115 RepID=A0A507DCU4_9FUNG|nr:beta-N-acetylhexosaminidase [Synchytrium endobioticum]